MYICIYCPIMLFNTYIYCHFKPPNPLTQWFILSDIQCPLTHPSSFLQRPYNINHTICLQNHGIVHIFRREATSTEYFVCPSDMSSLNACCPSVYPISISDLSVLILLLIPIQLHKAGPIILHANS